MNTEPVDLESAAAELYAADPDGFIARRTELVREARSAKDRQLATKIGKLRKPTRSAWLVNLYARLAAQELAELLELGAALRTAQEQLSAADLRRLSGQRNATVAAASRRAVVLAAERGYHATEAVRQEVSQTLQAALADPVVAEQVRAGTVTEAHVYGGFGSLSLPAAAATVGLAPEAPAATESEDDLADAADLTANDAAERSGDEQGARLAAEKAMAEAARTEAERRWQDAEAALDRAADEAEAAAEHAAELADQVAELASRLREAEQAKTEADDRAAASRAKMAELHDRVRAARGAYEAL